MTEKTTPDAVLAGSSIEQIASMVYLHGLSAGHFGEPGGQCTAPGCEWVSEAAGVERRDAFNLHVAEVIHALWSPAPGGAAEGGNGVSWKDRAGKNEALWREAEARAERLEDEAAEADAWRINLANRVTEVENIARAEVERHKAALEAADEHIDAWENLTDHLSDSNVPLSAAFEVMETKADYGAARAAVKAGTTGEAGA